MPEVFILCRRRGDADPWKVDSAFSTVAKAMQWAQTCQGFYVSGDGRWLAEQFEIVVAKLDFYAPEE